LTEANGSQREIGARFQEILELRHDLRNMRQAITLLESLFRDNEKQLFDLKSEIMQVKTRIMTAAGFAVALISVLAWSVEWYLKK
tara:strand:- start:314 stop:568 length:255 start_codon:yes stop_codon:yes gene_type:complete